MPRYFFTIHGWAQVEDDRDGTYLPDVAAALLCRVHNPRAAKKEWLQRSGFDDDRQRSSWADGFVLAVLPRPIKLCLVPIATRRGGLRRISRSCRSYCAGEVVAKGTGDRAARVEYSRPLTKSSH